MHNLCKQIHEIMLAHQAVELRAELQVKEYQQQQAKCQEMTSLLAQLGSRYTELAARARRVMDKQRMLSARSDGILQAMVDKASPELSEHEKKWFEELRRMKEEVAGAGRYDEGSLAARARLVSDLTQFSMMVSFNWLSAVAKGV